VRITSIKGYAIDFAFRSGGFTTSYGRRTRLANLLIAVAASDGTIGYGEVCQFSGATSAPLQPDELSGSTACCERLVGCEPRDIAQAVAALGPTAPANVRCGVDTALWDMMGQRTGEPVFRLLGGRRAARTVAYASLSSEPPNDMARAAEVARQKGIACFQMKIEGKPDLDIARIRAVAGSLRQGERVLADANGGLDAAGARAMSEALDGIDVLFEEPCRTFEENLDVARRIRHGVMLDQCLSSPMMYVRAIGEGAFAGVGIKPTNLGGLSPARTARDLCVAAGLAMKIDDSWAADVGTLGSIHVAAGVPEPLLIGTVDMRGYFDRTMFSGDHDVDAGAIILSDAPGLGLEPMAGSFGNPIFVVGDQEDRR